MSGRGRGLPLIRRPTSPPDSSLTTHPVPPERTFTGRSFGPGAATEIEEIIRPLKEIDSEAVHLYSRDPTRDNPTRNLLRVVERWENVRSKDGRVTLERDPTWGFYAFITDYSAKVTKNIPRAMETLTGIVRRELHRFTYSPYAEEAFRRFKLDLIEDEAVLEGASYDRIRAEFEALIQPKIQGLKASAKGLLEDDFDLWPRARYMACLVLDEAAVSMLVNVPQFEDLKEQYRSEEQERFNTTKVVLKVVDRFWERPPPDTLVCENHRGVVDCSIGRLPLLYHELTAYSGTGAVEEFYEHQRLGLFGRGL